MVRIYRHTEDKICENNFPYSEEIKTWGFPLLTQLIVEFSFKRKPTHSVRKINLFQWIRMNIGERIFHCDQLWTINVYMCYVNKVSVAVKNNNRIMTYVNKNLIVINIKPKYWILIFFRLILTISLFFYHSTATVL